MWDRAEVMRGALTGDAEESGITAQSLAGRLGISTHCRVSTLERAGQETWYRNPGNCKGLLGTC